jgi:hypothetical protein
VINEQVFADYCARMDINRGKKTRKMVHKTGQEIQFGIKQPMRNPVEEYGSNTRI